MINLKNTINDKNKEGFLNLFYEPEIENHNLTIKTKLNLFILRIDGSTFDYLQMRRILGNAAVTYVFSRKKYSSIENIEHEHIKEVQNSFRDYPINSGEGGELLLYCFLEAHLGAPKILSKMELKTASNDYVKGSDGIHLLDLGDGNYQLIFGESKMIADSTEKRSSLRKGIKEALESIKKVKEEGIGEEITLVDSNLMKESFNEDEFNLLKSIIKPSAKDEFIKKNNAFGIFLGFEVDITSWDLQSMDDNEFIANLKKEIKGMFEERYDYIKTKVQENGLDGFNFYFYALPFIKRDGADGIEKEREEIIKHIQ